MILDELPGHLPLPAPPTPSTAEAILRVANIPTVNPSIGVQLPNQMNGFNFWQQQAETVNGQMAVKKKKEKKSPKEKKTSTSAYGSSEGLPDDECPICHKFYPNNKKREHFASTHFQVSGDFCLLGFRHCGKFRQVFFSISSLNYANTLTLLTGRQLAFCVERRALMRVALLGTLGLCITSWQKWLVLSTLHTSST